MDKKKKILLSFTVTLQVNTLMYVGLKNLTRQVRFTTTTEAELRWLLLHGPQDLISF